MATVKCTAPKLTWDEIHNLAISFVIEWEGGTISDEQQKMIDSTLIRMGYPSGLSEDTYFDMLERGDQW